MTNNVGIETGTDPASMTKSRGVHSSRLKSLAPEEYFQWRAGEITRLEAFCDVVFGFAITLLVVSLEVPHTYAELIAAMRGFLPFAACFAQLIFIWRTHYRFSRRYGLEDPYTVLLNVILLFVVLFYVYPLKFVFTMLFSELVGMNLPENLGWHQASVLMRIYAAGFAAVFLLFTLMYTRAYNLRRELKLNPTESMLTLSGIGENAVMAVVGVASFLVALKSPGLAGWMYCLIGPLLWIHGSIFGKKARLLTEKPETSQA
jgi:uncharacterized membrane protein